MAAPTTCIDERNPTLNGIPDHLEACAPMPTIERRQRQIEAKNE